MLVRARSVLVRARSTLRCARSAGQIFPQAGLVDLPVAVLGVVEEEDGESVAELGPQSGATVGGSGVDVDLLEPETEVGEDAGEVATC